MFNRNPVGPVVTLADGPAAATPDTTIQSELYDFDSTNWEDIDEPSGLSSLVLHYNTSEPRSISE